MMYKKKDVGYSYFSYKKNINFNASKLYLIKRVLLKYCLAIILSNKKTQIMVLESFWIQVNF
jgi:hypothetical protein